MMRIFSHSPGRRVGAGLGQLARGLQELLLVAPDEEHFEELELQVAPRGFTADGDADQIGGLVVQTVGHVEIGFGERITLIEVDRGLAADGLVARDMLGRGSRRPAGREARPLVRAGLLDQEGGFSRRGRRRADRCISAGEAADRHDRLTLGLRGVRTGDCQASERVIEGRGAARAQDARGAEADQCEQREQRRPTSNRESSRRRAGAGALAAGVGAGFGARRRGLRRGRRRPSLPRPAAVRPGPAGCSAGAGVAAGADGGGAARGCLRGSAAGRAPAWRPAAPAGAQGRRPSGPSGASARPPALRDPSPCSAAPRSDRSERPARCRPRRPRRA